MSSPPAPPSPAFPFLQQAPGPSPEPEISSPPPWVPVASPALSPSTSATSPPVAEAPGLTIAASPSPISVHSPSDLSPSPRISLPNDTIGPELPAPTSPIFEGGSKSLSVGVPVGVALAVLLLLLGIAGVYWFKKKRGQGPPPTDKAGVPPPPPGKGQEPAGNAMSPQPLLVNADHHVVKISPDPYPPLPSPPRSEVPTAPPLALGSARNSSFTYEELEKATDGFSSANYLGHGGFGYVHRGVLPDGVEVAVKQLSARSFQGDREFQAEVEVISRVHHKHLVSLIGYCVSEGRRLLVYEFVPNKTLEFHLHVKEGPAMDWPTRLKIALGSGKGLAYLHEDCRPKIIHRDIKAANILLDEKFEPMVADFGLAKFASDNNSHVSTRVMGTFGYLAPEYASSGKLSDKSDVFSYGAMLLELITGRRPTDTIPSSKDDNLVDWVVRVLEGEASLDDLNEGIKPGQSEIYSLQDGADPEASKYGEVMKNFKNALGSGENASSEATTTNEYVMNLSVTSSEDRQEQEIEKKR